MRPQTHHYNNLHAGWCAHEWVAVHAHTGTMLTQGLGQGSPIRAWMRVSVNSLGQIVFPQQCTPYLGGGGSRGFSGHLSQAGQTNVSTWVNVISGYLPNTHMLACVRVGLGEGLCR